jgi:hypothetical protein
VADKWPRLSETLPHRGELLRCWSCGEVTEDLHRWQECDDRDQPEPIILVLCINCAAQIIEPHPRLYHQLAEYQPFPGAMTVCADCIHRAGTRCSAGRPVLLAQDAPIVAHVRYSGRKDGRRGELIRTWTKPATACDQKEITGAD